MAKSPTSSPSSLVNPLNNLDAALAELTHDLIPDFLTQVAACDTSDVDWTMAENMPGFNQKAKRLDMNGIIGQT